MTDVTAEELIGRIGTSDKPVVLDVRSGAEFAARDALPTPVQFERVMPSARALFPLGEAVEAGNQPT